MPGKKDSTVQKATPVEKKKVAKPSGGDGEEKAVAKGGKKMQKRAETYSVYIYRVLK